MDVVIRNPFEPTSIGGLGNRPVFFENLDGLRALCFLVVFFYHGFYTEFDRLSNSPIYQFIKFDIFGNGNLGVNFFFVLSGFLITFLLIKEREEHGSIRIAHFWFRRILRIWPLFFCCVIFGFIAFPMLKRMMGSASVETADPLYYITFLNNFDMLYNGMPDASVLAVLWSIAVEEQFYLIWPVALSVVPIRFYPYFFGSVIAGTLIFRSIHLNSPESGHIFEIHTLSCIGDMTIGAWGAYLALKGKAVQWFRQLPRASILMVYLLFILIFFFRDEILFENSFLRVVERSFIAVVILCIILEQNYSDRSIFKLVRSRTLSGLGRISYGLYCLHFVGILITLTLTKILGWNEDLWQVMILETALALALTIVLAQISHRVLERPFLKLKSRYAIIRSGADHGVAVPGPEKFGQESPMDQIMVRERSTSINSG